MSANVTAEVFDLNVSGWHQYCMHSDSLPDLLQTDAPLEMIIKYGSSGWRGIPVEVSLAREDGCLLLPVAATHVRSSNSKLEPDDIERLLQRFYNSRKYMRRINQAIADLQVPDPFELPQRKHPDFYHKDEQIGIVYTMGFGATVTAETLTVKDSTEIQLTADVMGHYLNFKDYFLRVWARWPGSEAAHLVCWLINTSANDVTDIRSHIQVIFTSNDFYHRIHILHDRWRTSRGLPSVSTPKEMTLLPIPEGLPKPVSRGISSKRRRRR